MTDTTQPFPRAVGRKKERFWKTKEGGVKGGRRPKEGGVQIGGIKGGSLVHAFHV